MNAQTTNALSIGSTLSQLLFGVRGEPANTSMEVPTQPEKPAIDLAVQLAATVGRLGAISQLRGGFRIKTDKPLAFPFGPVLSELAARNFQVTVSQSGEYLVIDARP